MNEEEKKYYVSMTDRVLSGWGEAKDKINKLVFECRGYDEAVIVRDNAKARSDMIHVNICINKPYYNKRQYYVQDKTTDYTHWYVKGFFEDKKEVTK